jgi:DNA polymerase-3 subunit delta'
MALEDVPGQERAAAVLMAALESGRLAHAYLFVGPGGVGRLAMARELASILLCQERGTRRCGACRSCRSFEAGSHPDYHEEGVPEGKQELPIRLVQTLQDHAFVKPVLAPRRVFVLKDAEKMNLESANCFLKTLEEPPGGSCFILIATGLRNVPQTVVSRCQIIRFIGLPLEGVEQVLRSSGVDGDDAWWLARRCWGSPGLALRLKEAGLHLVNRDLTGELLTLSPGEAYGLTDQLSDQADDTAASRPEAREALQELLECAAVLYRDLAALAVAPGRVELFNKALGDRLGEAVSQRPAEFFIECADRAFEAIERVGANANRQVALDDLFGTLAGARCSHNSSRSAAERK